MNKTKIISVIILTGAVIFLGAFILSGKNTGSDSAQPLTETVSGQEKSGGAEKLAGYSMADVEMHGSASSCWTAVSGSVYDVTSWIGQHPGGREAILSLCGKDGTAAFNEQHGGREKQANTLATFKIGDLSSN